MFLLVSQRLAEPLGDRIEPLVDGALQFRLLAGEQVAKRAHVAARLRLQPEQLGMRSAVGSGPAAGFGRSNRTIRPPTAPPCDQA